MNRSSDNSENLLHTFWDDAYLSIRSPRSYLRWAMQPLSKSFGYFALLAIMVAVISFLHFRIAVFPRIEGWKQWVNENIPTMIWQGGELSVENERPLTLATEEEFFFKIDPTTYLEEAEIDSFYQSAVLVVKDGVLLSSSGDVRKTVYMDVGLENYRLSADKINRTIDRFRQYSYGIVPLCQFAAVIVGKVVYTAFFSLLYSLFSFFKIPFARVWGMSFYALTPAYLISLLSLFITPLSGLFTLTFLVYMTLAVIHLRRFMEMKKI